MRINEILTEMSGVFTKRPGDTVMLNAGQGKFGRALSFHSNMFVYPNPTQGEFTGPKEKTAALTQANAQANGKIHWTNPEYQTQARAFAIREFTNELDQPVYFGKFLKTSKNINQGGHDNEDAKLDRWDVNSLEKFGYVNKHKNRLARLGLEYLGDAYVQSVNKNDWSIYDAALANKGTTAPGTTVAAPAAQSLAPSAVLSKLDGATAKTILAEVTKKFSESNPDLVEITKVIANGTPGPWTVPQSVGPSQFAKEFCEILQPLALITGAFAASVPTQKGSIFFNTGKSAQFIDSSIKSGNNTILVSSKQGGGTTSSVGGLVPYLDEWKKNTTPQDIATYNKEIKVLEIIGNSGIKPSPNNIGVLAVPVLYGIIDQQDAEDIAKMDSRNPGDLLRNNIPNPIPKTISKKLKNIILNSPQSPKHGPSPYYQSLNWCMKEASTAINNDPKMDVLLKLIFQQANYILVSSTVPGKGLFEFVQKQGKVNFTLGESYSPYEAKKKIAFKIT